MKMQLAKKLRTGLLVIVSLLLFASAFFLFLKIVQPDQIKKDVTLLTYNQKAEVKYRVYLKPNGFFSQNSMEQGESYLTVFTDYINTFFTYNLKTGEEINLSGTYNVTAKLQAIMDKDLVAWEKDYLLLPDVSFAEKGKDITITQNLPINLNKYIDYVLALNEIAQLGNSDVNLIVTWNVTADAATKKGHIREKISPTMIIPVAKKVFQVGGELVTEKPGSLTESRQVKNPENKKNIIILSISTSLLALILLMLILKTKNKAAEDSPRDKINSIFRKYKDRLVRLESDFSLSTKKIILVKTIDDLIKIADELNKPILFKTPAGDNSVEAADLTADFFVIDELLVYSFSISGK